MSEGLTLSLPPELLDRLADEVAERVLARLAGREADAPSPWLSGAAACAEYLGWPTERVYKRLPAMPHYREGGRLMFRRAELDAWLDGCREGRAQQAAVATRLRCHAS